MTPTKDEILERALHLYQQRNHMISENEPEIDELKECGTWEEARYDLMRNYASEKTDKGYTLHIHKNVDTTKYVKKQICLDLEEIKRSNILISGMNQVGKTRLACYLAHTLRKNKFNVITFDNSGTWKDLSDIPNYRLISNIKTKISASRNMILDMSLLKPSRQKKFVNEWLEFLWLSAVNSSNKEWQIIILEECELYCKNLRGELAENIYRLMCVGANQKLRIVGITPCMSVIDPLFIRLCGQRFHFKLAVEENSLRKFRRYYGKDFTRIVQNLDVGFCLYYLNGRLEVLNIPLWQKPLTAKKTLNVPMTKKECGFPEKDFGLPKITFSAFKVVAHIRDSTHMAGVHL